MAEPLLNKESGDEVRQKMEAIIAQMGEMDSMVVAFSGGVDSSLVAALAVEAIGDGVQAVTAVSETLAGRELQEAKEVAAEVGVRHELIEFSELDDERFRANTPSRCFFCQSMRFEEIRQIADRVDAEVVASGTNASDTGDHRPGLEAMRRQGIYQPLLEHDVSKAEVREMARILGLSVWNKPAMACLSSRIPHGLEVTEKRLRRIERAEDHLYDLGFEQFRVRAHGDLARIEIAVDELDEALSAEMRATLGRRVREAGFLRAVLDMGGYRSGSLNPTTTTMKGNSSE